jgi:hypothetical protein
MVFKRSAQTLPNFKFFTLTVLVTERTNSMEELGVSTEEFPEGGKLSKSVGIRIV